MPPQHTQERREATPHKHAENRLLSRIAPNCRKYCGVLTSAFNHFANTNIRKAITPDTTHHVPYRPELRFFGFCSHAVYAIAIASTGATRKNVSS